MKSNKWSVMAVMTLGAFMAMLDGTIVSVALPQMQNAFQTDFSTISWVVTAYLLAQAAVVPIIGYLSDRIGSRLTFQAALTLFTIGSLLCALAPGKEALIALRALQGLGGGALIPMTFAIIYRLFPPDERGTATAVLGVSVLLAPSFGPVIGGYLVSTFTWNAIFTLNVPIGILTLLLTFLVMAGDKSEQTRSSKGERLDILGLLLSMVGFTVLVYGITEAGSKGWGATTVVTSLPIGAAVLLAFMVVELRAVDPVLDLRIFRNYTFTISNVLMWIITGVFVGSLFLIPFFFENVQHNTALSTGEFLISQGLANGVGIAISGRLYKSVQPGILIVAGLLFLIGGTYELTQVNVNTTGQALQIWLMLRGFGVGLLFQPLQTLALSMISNEGMAKASSLVSVTRLVTTAIALAVLTTYLTQQTTTHATAISNALQTHNLSGAAATCALAGPALTACVGLQATILGLHDTFWIVQISYAACVLLALVVGRDPAIEAHKRAKLLEGQVQMANTPHTISRLSANGEEIMGPEILLWSSLENNVVDDSVLTIEGNHFCVLKCGAILDAYETGQHTIQTPSLRHFGTKQLTFLGEPIPWQYEVFYINRAKLYVKASGTALSREMAQVHYSVDYAIHVATCKDAIQLVQHMSHLGHKLTLREINTHTGPIIESIMNQLLLATPLEQLQGPQMLQDLSQVAYQHFQPFLSIYGITLGAVTVQELTFGLNGETIDPLLWERPLTRLSQKRTDLPVDALAHSSRGKDSLI